MSNAKRDVTRISHNTKIVATLGPGSNNVQLLEDMIRVGGLNVVRFNFSHGTPEFHQENARIVREAAKRAGQEIAILADLQGPKIRVGKIAGGSIELSKGERWFWMPRSKAKVRATRSVWTIATCLMMSLRAMFCGWMTVC